MGEVSDIELVAAPNGALHAQFRADVLAGMAEQRKAIPARWFYDHRGSQLFEDITRLPEYYPTRAEIEILADRGPQIALAVGKGRALVEFGAGSATKTPLLLAPLLKAAAQDYVTKNQPWPKRTEACDKAS